MSPLSRQKLEEAIAEVTAAESALESALGQLQQGVRAEKVTISAVLESAFARIRAARSALAALHEESDDR